MQVGVGPLSQGNGLREPSDKFAKTRDVIAWLPDRFRLDRAAFVVFLAVLDGSVEA